MLIIFVVSLSICALKQKYEFLLGRVIARSPDVLFLGGFPGN